MSLLTGALYGLLLVYLGGWYLGHWTGNFSLLLFVLTTVTFFYWLAERFRFAPKRIAAAAAVEQQLEARREQLRRDGIQPGEDTGQAHRALLAQPWWLDWTAGLFPVILVVFLLRSFLFEPFKIPSGSMIPTLRVGDLILVNKFHYGVRLPVINRKVIDNHAPQLGDVMVFRFPAEPSIDYIKRVVGLPGDRVTYRAQQLSINGAAVPLQRLPDPGFYDESVMRYFPEFTEKLGAVEHHILVNPQYQPYYGAAETINFPYRQNCEYFSDGVSCKVPAGHYFVMGDNRDNSQDSRFWGFVPDANIVGKAFFVWMNFSNPRRIGAFH